MSAIGSVQRSLKESARSYTIPSPVAADAGAALLVLIAATTAVCTPRGLTRYGQRQQLWAA